MRRAAAGFAVLAVAVLLIGCGSGPSEGDPETGKALYIERCQDCHGSQGELSAAEGARPLRDLTADAIGRTLGQYQRVTDDAPWWAELKSGLKDRQIRDLLDYLATLDTGH